MSTTWPRDQLGLPKSIPTTDSDQGKQLDGESMALQWILTIYAFRDHSDNRSFLHVREVEKRNCALPAAAMGHSLEFALGSEKEGVSVSLN